jgi:hypothetical protein
MQGFANATSNVAQNYFLGPKFLTPERPNLGSFNTNGAAPYAVFPGNYQNIAPIFAKNR